MAAVGAGAASAFAGWFGGASQSAGASVEWHQQHLAQTRSASENELRVLRDAIAQAAAEHGYEAAAIAGGIEFASMSVNPRGNDVGKIAIVLDDSNLLTLTREFRSLAGDRQVMAGMWTDGEAVVGLPPAVLADAINPRSQTTTAAAVSAARRNCCSHLGAPGTCCEFNFQGLFECCVPCAFALPLGPAFLACALVWCSYCATAHCRRWYHTC